MSSSIPPATDPSAPTPSDRLWLRSELMGTQVITRDTGRRLGVVGEVVVDIDRREVVALGLRDNPLTRFLPGLPRWMPLASIRQVGDVILVDSADSLSESFNPERYSKVINCQVITESGVQLGRVLGFSFDIETGDLTTLVIGALGVPLLGEGVLSTWELAVGEIVSSGTDRIIVYEGAEDKLKQLGTGLLEKLGIGGSSWEEEERERFRGGMIPAENQLPAGQPSVSEQRRIQPATSRAVLPESELDYVELEERREREPLRQRLYLDEEEREEGGLRRQVPYEQEAYGRRTDDRRDSDDLDRYGRRPSGLDDGRDWEERPFRARDGGTRFPEREEEPPEGSWDRGGISSRPDEDWRYDQERDSGSRGRTPRGRMTEDIQREPESWRGVQDEPGPSRDVRPMAGERGAPGEAWPDRPARRTDWSARERAPEARPTGSHPSDRDAEPLPESSGDPRRNRETASRDTRPPSERRGQPEPIDVEPEVLDDPW